MVLSADVYKCKVMLHCRHSFAIPFEDFNPFCHIPVSLDLDRIFEKVILGKRGGYCFEVNLLFQTLLKKLGYQASPIFCRPFSGEGVKLPLTHRLIKVSLEGKLWIADVGLGGNGWIAPLLFQIGEEQEQFGRAFQLSFCEPDDVHPAYGRWEIYDTGYGFPD